MSDIPEENSEGDEQSSTTLTLNLRGTPVLDRMADWGEPSVLTLRKLTRRPPVSTASSVRIGKNPAVPAAAADLHGPHSAPLVCRQVCVLTLSTS
ncbi:hypothetical protein ACFC5Z_09045 [Streptomyces sp. NPDC056004]|uniref:hypothetical protein n=1 Tax=Streptomyces sp. NPDC056004 TaxID=3345677 RepID=UPI0035E1B7F9